MPGIPVDEWQQCAAVGQGQLGHKRQALVLEGLLDAVAAGVDVKCTQRGVQAGVSGECMGCGFGSDQ